MAIEVTLAITASSADSVSEKVVSNALEGKLGGASTSSIHNFAVQFSATRRLFSARVTHATRALGTATVTFEVMTSLSLTNSSDAASFEHSLEDDLESSVSDGSLSSALQASCGCADLGALAVSVVPTREYPTREPTPLPSAAPTYIPFLAPSLAPQLMPSVKSTPNPSANPSPSVPQLPTSVPSLVPSHVPLQLPTTYPSSAPMLPPSLSPSALPTSSPKLNSDFSVDSVESASTNPLVAGGVFILCVTIAILVCRMVYKKVKTPQKHSGVEKKPLTESESFRELRGMDDWGLDNAGNIEIVGVNVELEDEEAAIFPRDQSSGSSAGSKFNITEQKGAEEIERFKPSTESKMEMEIRQQKMSRLKKAAEHEEAAKAACLAAKLKEAEQEAEFKDSNLKQAAQYQEALEAEVVQDQEALQAEVVQDQEVLEAKVVQDQEVLEADVAELTLCKDQARGATDTTVLHSVIANRRGSLQDATHLKACNEVGDRAAPELAAFDMASSILASSHEVLPPFQSRPQSLETPNPLPWLAASKASTEDKWGRQIFL